MALDSFRYEQTKLLYAGLPTALAINAAAAAVVALRFAATTPVDLLAAWLMAMVVALLLRGLVWWRWRQAGAGALEANTPWLLWFRLTTMFTGMGWACSVWLLLPPGGYAAHGFDVGFLCIVLLGLSAGAVASLSVDTASALGYRLPMIVAIGVELASDNSETGRALGVLALLYLLYVTANSARMSHSVHENIRLRLEADAREALLHQSEDRLNEAQHLAGLGSFDWNPVSGELQWSDEHFRLWGLTPGAQNPDYALFRQGLHADDVARVEAVLQRALSGGANYDCEHRVCRPDGSVLHIHGRGQVWFDEQGRAVRMIGTVLDITVQKLAAEALAASRDNLQRTLEATGDGIFAYDGSDSSGRLLFANAEFFRMWRIPESEILTTGRTEIIAAAKKLFVDPDKEVALIQHILTLDSRHEDRVKLNDGRVLSRRSIPILGHAGVSRIWSFRDVTTEERVLELAQANEAQQSALLGAFPGSIGRLDADLRYTYVNERLAQRLGASAQQIMGQAIGKFLGAERGAELRALIAKAQAGERVVFEEQYPGAIDVVDQFTLAVGKDPLTGVDVVYLFGIDISELKRAEQALRISQERFRDFADSSSDWYWESDAEHRFTFFSENAGRILGRDKREVLGRRRTEIVAENNLNPAIVVEQHAAQLQAREAFREFEYRVNRADGSEQWVSVSGLPHFDAELGFVGYRGTARDITAKKRIENQLADRKVHLEELVEQRTVELSTALEAAKQAEENLRIAAVAFESHEGLFVTDAHSVILRVNSAFTEITGFSAEEAIGQTPRIFKSGRHNAEFYQAMWQQLNSTGRWQGEIWDKRKDGTIYPKWLTISVVKNEEGEVTHYVGSHFDITERKLAEERIHELAFFDQLTGLPNLTVSNTLIYPLRPPAARANCELPREFVSDLPAQCRDRVRDVALGSDRHPSGCNLGVGQVFRGRCRFF